MSLLHSDQCQTGSDSLSNCPRWGAEAAPANPFRLAAGLPLLRTKRSRQIIENKRVTKLRMIPKELVGIGLTALRLTRAHRRLAELAPRVGSPSLPRVRVSAATYSRPVSGLCSVRSRNTLSPRGRAPWTTSASLRIQNPKSEIHSQSWPSRRGCTRGRENRVKDHLEPRLDVVGILKHLRQRSFP